MMRFVFVLIISFLLLDTLVAQQNPYQDNISKIISSKKENQSILLTAVVSEWLDDKTFKVEDKTGSIHILHNDAEKPDLVAGDELSIVGKVKLTEKGDKEILMISFRKLKFVKDPSNCCRPEVD